MSNLPKDNDISSINRRLDTIISILLNPTKFQEANNREKIEHLAALGFDSNEIAKILNTTPGLVSKERSVLKKRKVKKNE